MSGRAGARLFPLGDEVTHAAGLAGAKAARLARAALAGLPVLPGWVLPVAEAAPALSAGAAAVRHGRPAAARRAVLGYRLDDGLAAALREAVTRLGGRVIVRSSSPLEADSRWSGAFSSVAEVGAGDVERAVLSCWSSAFAVDPLERLAACRLPPSALQLGVLLQPEIRLAAGGVARVTADAEVIVEGVLGHPGAMLAGWAEGASARVRLPAPVFRPALARVLPGVPVAAGRRAAADGPAGGEDLAGLPGTDGEDLARLLGTELVTAAASLAGRVWQLLGDDVIEWAAGDGGIWLLQALRSAPAPAASAAVPGPATRPRAAGPASVTGNAQPASRDTGVVAPPASTAELLASRAWMPLLAATVLDRGEHVAARPTAPGIAAGRLVACWPHERPAADATDAILLVDQPVPALAPLLFSARGVIARAGAPGSHLAGVARSLGIPMVTGCHPGRVTGPMTGHLPGTAAGWLAAVNGATGDVALMRGTDAVMI